MSPFSPFYLSPFVLSLSGVSLSLSRLGHCSLLRAPSDPIWKTEAGAFEQSCISVRWVGAYRGRWSSRDILSIFGVRREWWVTVCGPKITAFSRKQRPHTNLPREPERQGRRWRSLISCFCGVNVLRDCLEVATCSAQIDTSALMEGHNLLDVSKRYHAGYVRR